MNILVVDDEDMIRGVAAFFREEGYHVILAKDGQEALEKFHEFPYSSDSLGFDVTEAGGFGC